MRNHRTNVTKMRKQVVPKKTSTNQNERSGICGTIAEIYEIIYNRISNYITLNRINLYVPEMGILPFAYVTLFTSTVNTPSIIVPSCDCV